MKTLRRVSTVFGAVIAVALMCGATALAQERPAPATSAHDPQESDKARGDGIKVHGHWAIDVRNPDGTLSSHNEFENALIDGAQALAVILSRAAPVGFWRLRLLGNEQLCTDDGVARYACSINEPGDLINPSDPRWLFHNLQLSAPTGPSGAYLGTLELSGSVTVSFAGSIEYVEAIVLNASVFVSFSGRTLVTPIQVAAGQTVFVRVTYSFS